LRIERAQQKETDQRKEGGRRIMREHRKEREKKKLQQMHDGEGSVDG
jgi:hypothetical protein